MLQSIPYVNENLKINPKQLGLISTIKESEGFFSADLEKDIII